MLPPCSGRRPSDIAERKQRGLDSERAVDGLDRVALAKRTAVLRLRD